MQLDVELSSEDQPSEGSYVMVSVCATEHVSPIETLAVAVMLALYPATTDNVTVPTTGTGPRNSTNVLLVEAAGIGTLPYHDWLPSNMSDSDTVSETGVPSMVSKL